MVQDTAITSMFQITGWGWMAGGERPTSFFLMRLHESPLQYIHLPLTGQILVSWAHPIAKKTGKCSDNIPGKSQGSVIRKKRGNIGRYSSGMYWMPPKGGLHGEWRLVPAPPENTAPSKHMDPEDSMPPSQQLLWERFSPYCIFFP